MRYTSLAKMFPDAAAKLFEESEEDAKLRRENYKRNRLGLEVIIRLDPARSLFGRAGFFADWKVLPDGAWRFPMRFVLNLHGGVRGT